MSIQIQVDLPIYILPPTFLRTLHLHSQILSLILLSFPLCFLVSSAINISSLWLTLISISTESSLKTKSLKEVDRSTHSAGRLPHQSNFNRNSRPNRQAIIADWGVRKYKIKVILKGYWKYKGQIYFDSSNDESFVFFGLVLNLGQGIN